MRPDHYPREVAIAAVVLLVVLVGLVVFAYRSNSDFAHVALPAIVTGVATIALAALTVVQSRRASYERDAHSRNREDRAAATRARLVLITNKGNTMPVEDAHRMDANWWVRIRNVSSLPILDVHVSEMLLGDDPLQGDAPEMFRSPPDLSEVLEPGHIGEIRYRMPQHVTREGGPIGGKTLHFRIGWTDQDGQEWNRLDAGEPQRVNRKS